MSKLVGIKTYERFRSLWENDAIDEFSLNFIIDTGLLYTHGIFINGAVFGTAANGAVPLSIAGITNTLALSSHTHSNYLEKNADIDISSYKIKSGDKDLLFYSGGSLYLGNITSPTYISGNNLYSVRGTNVYDILDTSNFSVSNTLPTGYTYNNTAYIKYGSNSHQIDYVKRINTSLSFDYLNTYTLAGTNLLNGVQYGYITLYTDNVYTNPSWAQLRINIPGKSIQYRTSADANTWINLDQPNIPLNALNVAGIVSAPSSTTTNKVWKTDGSGNPAWRDELSYTFSSLKFLLISGTDLMTYNTLAVRTILAGSNVSFSHNDGVLTINAQSPTYGVVSKTLAGLAPQLPNEDTVTKFLRQDGTWSVPAYPTKSSWNYDDRYVSSLTINGNYLRWVKNGSNNDITIPYATSAGTAKGLFFQGDGSLKLYSRSGGACPSCGTEEVCLQTSIDDTDGQTHSHPTEYGNRCGLALQPRGGYVTINEYTAIHTGNILNFALPISGGTMTGNISMNNSSSITNLPINGGIYWNPYVESASDGSDAASITLVSSGPAGGTTLVLTQQNDSNDTIQFVTNGSANLYHNSNKIWDAGNDGSGSGLDADSVDGLHHSSFLRKDVNDSTSCQYTFTKTDDHAIQIGTIRGYGAGSCSGQYLHIYERVHIGSPNGWGSKDAPSYGLSTYGGAWLATDTGNVGIGTTSPATKLDVRGTVTIYPNSNLSSSTSYTYPGGAYYSTGSPNIRLYGDNNYGLSTIEFLSSKGSTSINVPSDCAFILFQPYGYSSLAGIGSYPGLNSSGESNKLIIGVNNDSDDWVCLQTPNGDGLKHIVGTSVYNIITSRNIGSQSVNYANYLAQIIAEDKLPPRFRAYGQNTSDHRNVDTTCLENGFYWVNAGTMPPNVGDADIITVNANSSYGHQLAFKFSGGGTTGSGYDGKDLYTRIYSGGSWLPWYTILTSGNFHNYALPISGGTVSNSFNVSAHGITVSYAPLNSSWCHIYSSPTTNFIFNSNVYCMGNFVDYNTGHSWIHTGNIGSLSVNYANSAGSASSASTATRATYLDGHGVNPDNSHPGYGARVFYSWNAGQAGNSSSGYSNGITIGSHPSDQAYGFQIVQNMWDDRTYTRRYNGGWQEWRTLAWYSDFDVDWPSGVCRGYIKGNAISTVAHLLINNATWASNWYWDGKSGQPTWLWGSNDGVNMYVWNPSNFSVNYANSAGSATSASQVTINYNNNSNSTYQVLWGSGNTCYGTAGIYVNPYYNYVYATNFYTTSDRSKKQDISEFSEHIRKFQMKDTKTWHYGVIAQEVEEMFRDGEEGNMTVNYSSILSYYVGCLENSVAGLEDAKRCLENRVKELEEKIKVLETKQNKLI